MLITFKPKHKKKAVLWDFLQNRPHVYQILDFDPIL
jgi:hypothetical protein